MVEGAGRPDLGAMIGPLIRALIAMEQPILREHDLTMWAYAVLLQLEEQPIRTQAALAGAIGADKTRIIAVLDDLTERGLIRRQPDPADRRARLLSITPEGRDLRDTAQAEVQRQEEELLKHLPPAQRREFLSALRTLVDVLPGQKS